MSAHLVRHENRIVTKAVFAAWSFVIVPATSPATVGIRLAVLGQGYEHNGIGLIDRARPAISQEFFDIATSFAFAPA